jgi:uncharacterized protein
MTAGPGRIGQDRTICTSELQLSIFVRAGDLLAGRPLYREIIDRARAAGLSGATAIRGMQGFGPSGKLHSPGLLGLRGTEPVVIEISDDPARVRAFLPVLDSLIGSGLLVLKPVTVTRKAARELGTTAATAAPS